MVEVTNHGKCSSVLRLAKVTAVVGLIL
jgi:hypothetical protein